LTPEGSLAEEVRMLRYCLSGAAATIDLPAPKSAQHVSDIQVIFKSGDHAKVENIALTNASPAAR
jgi:hypothetical protein